MHNDCPGRRVFVPFKSCPGFVLGGGGGLHGIDTCISHRYVKFDIVRPTSVDQIIHASLKMCRSFLITKQLWIKTILNWLGYASAHRQAGLFQEKRGTAVKFRGR